MPFIPVAKENSGDIELYYEDHGEGDPIVLIHGWPLSGRSWEKQIPSLLDAGFRVITYDRRGFGDSDRPTLGYDYDTLAKDLDTLLIRLDLRNATLVGFSMGGGEVARYLGTYGTERVSRAIFVSAIPPFLLKTPDNPKGVDRKVFEGIKEALASDRPAFLSSFFSNFYNVDELSGERLSDDLIRLSWTIAAGASPIGSLRCVDAWLTDFRDDLKNLDIPVLVVHGDSDRIVPLEASGERMPELIPGCELTVIPGGPHGLNWTHAPELNHALLRFLGSSAMPRQRAAG